MKCIYMSIKSAETGIKSSFLLFWIVAAAAAAGGGSIMMGKAE